MDCLGVDSMPDANAHRPEAMTFETIRRTLTDSHYSEVGAIEARLIAVKAIEDARAMIETMDDQVALQVARASRVPAQ